VFETVLLGNAWDFSGPVLFIPNAFTPSVQLAGQDGLAWVKNQVILLGVGQHISQTKFPLHAN
jgi:hypothetical protein